MTPDHRRVLDLVNGRTSPEEAISRDDLVRLTGIPDRTVRRLISELVTEHGCKRIVAAASGGYFVADEPEHRAAYARREIRKAVHSLNRAKDVAGPQVFLEEAGQVRMLVTGAESASAVLESRDGAQDGGEGDLPVHGNTRSEDELVLGPDGKPKKCWCGTYLRGKQEKYCSDFHKDIANGRRKVS